MVEVDEVEVGEEEEEEEGDMVEGVAMVGRGEA